MRMRMRSSELVVVDMESVMTVFDSGYCVTYYKTRARRGTLLGMFVDVVECEFLCCVGLN
jgi:hypothetical protein